MTWALTVLGKLLSSTTGFYPPEANSASTLEGLVGTKSLSRCCHMFPGSYRVAQVSIPGLGSRNLVTCA